MASYVAGEAFDPLPLYEVFWTEWLPRAAFDAMAAKAARLTASAFTKFGEYSLLETLDAHPSSAKDSAVALLAKAISLNRGGHPGEALAPARAAALAFDSARMPAAAAVARGEIIYAARWADLYRECKQTEEVLLKSLGPRYPWTEGNARLDHASCLLRMGEEGPARIEIEKARRHLNAAHLWPLALRASQYVAGIDAEIGNYGAVWDTASNGLRFYWANPASIYRAEAFQFILQQACSGSGWMECAQVFYRATIRSAHEAGNAEMEVANRSRLAELLQQLGDYSGEMHELDELKRLLDGLGQTQDVRTLRWEAALHRIEADLATNSARDPLPELDRLAAGASAREAMQRIALEQDRGLAFQARGNFARAAQSFTRAIELNGELAQSAGSWLLRIPATETVASSYRNLTLIQLMQEHDPVSALATWRQFRPNCTRAPQSVTMAVLRDEVVVWAGDGQATKARRVEQPVQELRRLSGEFLSLCSSPQSNTAEIRRIGHQLYGALLDREVRTLHSGTVSLSTDSWLSQIPFVALTDDSGKYLRSRFQFVQGFGPPANPAPATIAIGSTALIVSAPVAVAPGQLRLPFLSAAEREAEDVAKRFSHAVVSGDATPSWLAENIPRADVFHFSGHGWSNGGNGALILPGGPEPGASIHHLRRSRETKLVALPIGGAIGLPYRVWRDARRSQQPESRTGIAECGRAPRYCGPMEHRLRSHPRAHGEFLRKTRLRQNSARGAFRGRGGRCGGPKLEPPVLLGRLRRFWRSLTVSFAA